MKEAIESGDIKNSLVVLDLGVDSEGFEFDSSILTALSAAELEVQNIEATLTENIETLKNITPDCDKTDYILATTIGAICGVIDIFLVGKPGESPVGNITDKWFENRTKDFARLCGWDDKKNDSLSSAIRKLEKKFKIPYDQTGIGDVFEEIRGLNTMNHHFKSLGHNPSLLGLFLSMLDQFYNTSHFVDNGELLTIAEADKNFELRGNNVPSKLFAGFVNWFGHLISDMSGSSNSAGRGMGIPSPLWTWTNDIIAIKRKLNIPVSTFNKTVNELASDMYKKGYDVRFQVAQAIPVFINEMLVRFIYTTRRFVKYVAITKKEDLLYPDIWKSCEPFSNATVKRMLTVAHGTFCLVDVGDSVARGFVKGGGVGVFMRLNIVGVGRFAISLYGEVNLSTKRLSVRNEIYFREREKLILEDYISGLKYLADIYDDSMLLTFAEDLQNSDMYKEAFEKTVLLAEKRNVPNDKILKNKSDIDIYFNGVNN